MFEFGSSGNLQECIKLKEAITGIRLGREKNERFVENRGERGEVGVDRPGEVFFGRLGKTWNWSRPDG